VAGVAARRSIQKIEKTSAIRRHHFLEKFLTRPHLLFYIWINLDFHDVVRLYFYVRGDTSAHHDFREGIFKKS